MSNKFNHCTATCKFNLPYAPFSFSLKSHRTSQLLSILLTALLTPFTHSLFQLHIHFINSLFPLHFPVPTRSLVSIQSQNIPLPFPFHSRSPTTPALSYLQFHRKASNNSSKNTISLTNHHLHLPSISSPSPIFHLLCHRLT